MKRRNLLTVLFGITALMSASQVFSQTAAWPNKPIKMIVPFAPGVSPDVVARIIADKLTQSLGQPVIVDNRPGAGGMIAGEAAALAPADGYTTFFTVKAVMAIAPNVYRNAKFNPIKDFKPVSQILTVPHVITAAPNAPFSTMQELVDYAKRNPGKVDYASLGVGSQPHIAMATWANKISSPEKTSAISLFGAATMCRRINSRALRTTRRCKSPKSCAAQICWSAPRGRFCCIARSA